MVNCSFRQVCSFPSARVIPGFGSLAAGVGVSLPRPLLPLGTELLLSLALLSHRSSKACVVLAVLLGVPGLLPLPGPLLWGLHNREVVTSLSQCFSVLLISSTTSRQSKGLRRCQAWPRPRYPLAVLMEAVPAQNGGRPVSYVSPPHGTVHSRYSSHTGF